MSYVIPEVKTQDKRTFMFNGAKLWNSLDVITKSIQCKDRFKKSVKKTFSSLKKSENSQAVQ